MKPRIPVAPPVYRPQPVPKVLQTKKAHTAQSGAVQKRVTPAAPPAYRPQPVPKVLQQKKRLENTAPSPVKPKIVVNSAGGRPGLNNAVQAKIVFGPANSRPRSTAGLRLPQAGGSSARGSSIQRKIVWDIGPAQEPIIIEATFDRPTGTSNAGAHTTAISVFQQTAMEAVIGKTYLEAKRGLLGIFQALMQFPGGSMATVAAIEEAAAMIRTGAGLGNEAIQANWTSNLEELAKRYIQVRETLEHTHHQQGMGGRGNAGEGPALTNLHQLLQSVGNNWHALDRETAVGFMKKLIDLRNVPQGIDGDSLGKMLVQHVAQLDLTYPGLVRSGIDLAFFDSVCATLNVSGVTRMYVMNHYQQWLQDAR